MLNQMRRTIRRRDDEPIESSEIERGELGDTCGFRDDLDQRNNDGHGTSPLEQRGQIVRLLGGTGDHDLATGEYRAHWLHNFVKLVV